MLGGKDFWILTCLSAVMVFMALFIFSVTHRQHILNEVTEEEEEMGSKEEISDQI